MISPIFIGAELPASAHLENPSISVNVTILFVVLTAPPFAVQIEPPFVERNNCNSDSVIPFNSESS